MATKAKWLPDARINLCVPPSTGFATSIISYWVIQVSCDGVLYTWNQIDRTWVKDLYMGTQFISYEDATRVLRMLRRNKVDPPKTTQEIVFAEGVEPPDSIPIGTKALYYTGGRKPIVLTKICSNKVNRSCWRDETDRKWKGRQYRLVINGSLENEPILFW